MYSKSLDPSVLVFILVSHYTDTRLYLFSSDLSLPLIINKPENLNLHSTDTHLDVFSVVLGLSVVHYKNNNFRSLFFITLDTKTGLVEDLLGGKQV